MSIKPSVRAAAGAILTVALAACGASATRPDALGDVDATPPAASALPPGAVLQPDAAQNLLDIFKLAREYDAKFRAARFTFEATQQKIPQARAALLPTLSGSASRLHYDSDSSDLSTEVVPQARGRYFKDSYALSLKQPVYNRAYLMSLSQAHSQVRQAGYEFAAAQQDLLLRTATAYLGVLAGQDNLELATAEKTAVGRQLELAQARLEVGLATVTDVYDAQARFKLAEAGYIEALNDLEDRREALRQSTGSEPGVLAVLAKNPPLITPDPPDVGKWVTQSLKENFALNAGRQSVEVARTEVSRQRAGHFPSLDIVASRGRSSSSGGTGSTGAESNSTEAGLQLTVPILQGGYVLAATEEAKLKLEAARATLEDTRRATERAARAAFLGVTSRIAKVQALEQAVTAAESALEAKTEGFEAGINTNLDVLDAQRDLYRAKRDYAQSRYDYLLNLLRLKQAAGILDTDDLGLINGWLEAPAPAAPAPTETPAPAAAEEKPSD